VRTVWKFGPLTPGDPKHIEMPVGAVVRHFGKQGASLFLWAEVDSDAPIELRDVAVIGTGWAAPEDGTHLGTVMDGPFVWHLYARRVAAA
jgi:hypothetical protein